MGTASIEKSELLGRFLKNLNIRHNVLNAKHHEREADIIAQAGRKGNVTIATNMAGRGTDILLGGNPEVLAKFENKTATPEEFEKSVEKYREVTEQEKKDVIAAGGLYIVGTERHESRRIDNQLRGRAGRQGDPGASKFFLSLEDSLMRIFNGERLQRIMNTLKVPDDEPITARMVTRAIESAQRKVEGHNFDIRKHLLEYDDVMNQQRTYVYSLRRRILENNNVDEVVIEMLSDNVSDLLDTFAPVDGKKSQWDLDGLALALGQQFGVTIEFAKAADLNSEKLVELVKSPVKVAFDQQKEKLGPYFAQLQKMILLQTMDTRWKEHLAQVDHLKEGINLRAYGQKDPLIEYKKEAFRAFEQMQILTRNETLEKLLKVQIVEKPASADELEPDQTFDEEQFNYNNPAEGAPVGPATGMPFMPLAQPQQQMSLNHGSQGSRGAGPQGPREPITRDQPKVGRNDPCPCGSGKKFKKCHGAT